MPKAVISEVDDIVQIREKWQELLEAMIKLGFTREEIAGIVSTWVETLVERE